MESDEATEPAGSTGGERGWMSAPLWPSARSSLRERSPDRTLLHFAAGVLAVVVVLGLTDGLLAALREHLPPLCSSAACDPMSTTAGVRGLSAVDLTLGGAGIALY